MPSNQAISFATKAILGETDPHASLVTRVARAIDGTMSAPTTEAGDDSRASIEHAWAWHIVAKSAPNTNAYDLLTVILLPLAAVCVCYLTLKYDELWSVYIFRMLAGASIGALFMHYLLRIIKVFDFVKLVRSFR